MVVWHSYPQVRFVWFEGFCTELYTYFNSYPQVYPQVDLTVKNTICPGVEESGGKWSIEHLDRWVRNVQTSTPPTTKPPYSQTPNLHSGLYPQTSYLSNLYSLKNPRQNVAKCPDKCIKGL